MKKIFAFTLAEVLITLGVIGVVAALTIPGLMTKYHRSVVETKLEKFYSIMNQAIRMSIEEHDGITFDMSQATDLNSNGDIVLEWYKEYVMKYFTGISIEKVSYTSEDTGNVINNRYVKAVLKDGSGFYSYYLPNAKGGGILFIFYCLDASDKSCKPESYNGYKTFLFEYNSDGQIFMPGSYRNSNATVKASCYNTESEKRHACAELIRRNSWKIPSDYPWIK